MSKPTSIIPERGTKAYERFRASQQYTDLMVSHFCAASSSHSYTDELEVVLRGIYDGSIATPAFIRSQRGPDRKLSANAPIWFQGEPTDAQKDALIDEIISISQNGKTADLANLALGTALYMDFDATARLRRQQGTKITHPPLFRLNLTGSTGSLRFEDAHLQGDFRCSQTRDDTFNQAQLTNCNFNRATLERIFSRGSHFNSCFFDNGTLSKSVIDNGTFDSSMFIDTTLNEITFRDCVFKGCHFNQATINDCTFDNCTFIDCDMKDAKVLGNTTFKGTRGVLNGIKNADYMTCGSHVVMDESLPRTTDTYDVATILRSEIAAMKGQVYDGNVGYPEPHRDPDQARYESTPTSAGLIGAAHQGISAQPSSALLHPHSAEEDPNAGQSGEHVERLIAAGEKAGKVARFPGRGGGSGSGKQ